MTRRSWLQAVALFVCLVTPAAAADYRVVVQEIHAGRWERSQVTPDRKLAWIISGVNDHLLQVLDPARAVVLRQFYLPERIEFATVDAASRKVVVSTRSAIYLGRLTDDALEEILPGVDGAVLLDDARGLLAVLGRVPDPKRKETPRYSFRDERTLGVYDLKKKAWRHIQRTPIVAPYLGDAYRYQGGPALLFHEGAVLAGGVGGSLGSMIPITFSVDVHLDLASGKAKITTGPSSRFGTGIDIKPPKLKDAGPPAAVPEGYEGVDFKNDPKYVYPAPLVKAHEAAAAAVKKLRAEEIDKRLQLGDSVRDALPMPFAVQDDRVQLAMRRYLRIDGGFGSHSAVLTLPRDGKIAVGPSHNTSNNPFGRGNTLYSRLSYPGVELNDLITGQPLLPKALLEAKGDKDCHFLEGAGTLVHHQGHLAFYKPGRDKPEWTRKTASRDLVDTQMDLERKTVALLRGGEPILAECLRLADGEVVGTVPRPKDVTDNYMSMALSQDGRRLGVVHRSALLVFDAVTGKPLEKHAILHDSYGRGLQSWSGGWFVSGESSSQLFDDRVKKWTTPIPFTSSIKLQEIETPRGKRLLLQNYNGQCCLADPASGAVLSRWIAAEYGQHRAPLWNAVFAGGKAMVRPTGWIPALEVVDLRDNRVALTLHSVPGGKHLGFIAYTADGWWDCTPGAERHVAVFHKGVQLEDAARNERRSAAKVAERLAGLWK
ncbi:MAG TPA: hypothetical protein VEL76_32290 [Gemmataceae bacterium]|nr:hypothetical protein [Gemmataceae bacterium]